ncbi:PucR family transcriptional regulator [Streptomyces sp. NPDC004629]|uniref:PucR family transcriptional regulator n=1 Tax=Streptomyces sp. NPDC004629 TaxID=3364705 RepID=UPI0036807A42
MTEITAGCALGDLLGNDRLGLTLLVDRPAARGRLVRGARLLLPGEHTQICEDHILISLPDPGEGASMREYLEELESLPGSLIIAIRVKAGTVVSLDGWAGQHVVLGLPGDADPAELITEVARATARIEETLTRRLTTLQRSLAQALAAPRPLQSLTSRLAKVCSAVATIISSSGAAEHPTGPLPLSLLLPEIRRTRSESQIFGIEGWHGMAVRVSDGASDNAKGGWLLVASRRASFPDQYSMAAVYIAASLAETSMQIELAAQRQERAVRSAILEQALALRAERHDAELAERFASLGFSFGQETRCIVVELAQESSSVRDAAALDSMYHTLHRELTAEDIPHLLVLRENAVVGLLQTTASTARRTFVKVNGSPRDFLLGVGRQTNGVGDIVDSYHDAQLAVLVLLRRVDASQLSMVYEDFDFATRLFSDVGLEKMTAWAGELLRPIRDNKLMLQTLATYFEYQQNIMEAAKVLAVHHNSLRYRLSKIEAALNVSLRDPAAVSSLFLALTAYSMAWAESDLNRSITPSARPTAIGDSRVADAGGAVLDDAQQGLSSGFGAAIGPDR